MVGLGHTRLPFLRRIGPAYEQIAVLMREVILDGSLEPGNKLPAENELAVAFGVSRATVREALRGLAAEGLVVTIKGPSGGSFVARPSVGRISSQIRLGLSMLVRTEEFTLDDFLELRSFLEVPASSLAAVKRSDLELGELRKTLLSPAERATYGTNRDFHALLIDCAHNPLISVATLPLFHVLETRLDRSLLDDDFHDEVRAQHAEIADAVAGSDGDGAAALMRQHLEWLRLRYEGIWTLSAVTALEA